MATEAQLYAGFPGTWQTRGNEYFVSKDSAQDFARYIAEQGVRLLGIDGFILEADLTMPILDVMSDYSSGAVTQSHIESFLLAGQGSVSHYNFVLEVQ